MEDWLDRQYEHEEAHRWNQLNAGALGYAGAHRELAHQIRTLNIHLYPTEEKETNG